MPIQTIRSQRLYRQIADQLQQLINDGEFPPGTLLPPERELAQALGVSRASVREALIALEVVGQVAGEVLAVLFGYAHGNGNGVEGIAFTHGNILRELTHNGAEQGLAAIGQCGVDVTAVGTGGHAKGLVATGAVGGRGQEVAGQTGFAFKEHVAPATVRTAGSGCKGSGRSGEKCCASECLFHA